MSLKRSPAAAAAASVEALEVDPSEELLLYLFHHRLVLMVSLDCSTVSFFLLLSDFCSEGDRD